MVCESFWCWSGKNTAYSVVLSWENTLNSHLPRELWISDIFVQLFHSKSPKTPNFNLLKNLHSCSCSFRVKISGNTGLTNACCLFSLQESVKKPRDWVHSCPFPCTPAHPCLLSLLPSPNPLCGQSQSQGQCPAHSRKRCLKQCPVLFNPYLCSCFVKSHISADLTLELVPFSYTLSVVYLF